MRNRKSQLGMTKMLGVIAGVALLQLGAAPGGAWAATCTDCHYRTTALGGDLDNWVDGDGTASFISADEWITAGHGRGAGVYTSGNPPAAFSGPLDDQRGCAYCHDLTADHGLVDNPMLLANGGVLGRGTTADNGWNDVCLVCHMTGASGFDPDGAGAGYAAKNAASKKDDGHYGAKHIYVSQGGTFCWDCHDPHGDQIGTFMTHPAVTAVSDGSFGLPVALRPVTGFQNASAGFTSQDLVQSTRGADSSYQGFCQTCHAASGGALYYNRSSFIPLPSHNGADVTVCTVCHNAHGSEQVEAADLVVTLSDSPDPVSTGGSLTYTATVRNWGPSAVTGTTLQQILPAGATSPTASTTQGTCTVTAATVNCNLGSLALNAMATVTVRVTAPAAVTTLNSSVSVSSAVLDPNTANNSASATTAVQAQTADLAVSLTDSPDPVSTGGSLTYTATVRNGGPAAATGTTLQQILPAGATSPTASTTQGTCTVTATTVNCSLGSLALNATATVTVRVTAPAAATTLSSSVSASSTLSDPNTANNSATATTAMLASGVDYQETSVGQPPATVAPGGSWQVTDTAKNFGSAAATKSSSVRYYLSLDQVKSANDVRLTGSRSVAPLAAGASSTGTVKVTVPKQTAVGTYYLLACSDDTGTIAELDETNNCLAAASTVLVKK